MQNNIPEVFIILFCILIAYEVLIHNARGKNCVSSAMTKIHLHVMF